MTPPLDTITHISTTPSGYTPRSATSPQTTNTTDEDHASDKHEHEASLEPAATASPTTATPANNNPSRHHDYGYFTPQRRHLLRHTTIEHRLFSFISMNWRGRPLTDIRTIIELIGATTTKTGLTVQCAYDPNWYPTGVKITDTELAALPVQPHDWHGEWNYTITPQTRG